MPLYFLLVCLMTSLVGILAMVVSAGLVRNCVCHLSAHEQMVVRVSPILRKALKYGPDSKKVARAIKRLPRHLQEIAHIALQILREEQEEEANA